jgi:hypothetical protein
MNKTLATIAIGGSLVGGVALGLAPVAALATQPSFICPETGNGWVKTDGASGQTATYNAPDGFLIAEVCYKAGTSSSTYLVGPVSTVVIVSTLVNNGGQVADISHYSVRLIPAPGPTPTPTVTPTPEPTPTVTSTPTPEPTPTRTVEPTPPPTPTPPLDTPRVLAETGSDPGVLALLVGLGVTLAAAGIAGVVGNVIDARRKR